MAISSAVAVFTSATNLTQTTATINFRASATGTNQGANTVGVGISTTNSGSVSLIGVGNPLYTFTTAWGTTSSQKASGNLSVNISGLSPSTTYTGYIVVYGLGGLTVLGGGASSSVTFTTASPPPPPSQNYGPSISGSAVSGNSLSASSGSYNNASSVTTRIAFNTTGSFSGSASVRTSPYTVTDSDASSPPYYFAATDIVVGTNGSTYYYYSYSIISQLKVSFVSNGGSSADPVAYTANASSPNYITLPYVYRDGYTFNGWYTNSGVYVGGAYSSYQPSTSVSSTLYAQWTAFPVSQNYSPTLSGSAVTGTSLSATAGSYNYAASVDTRIAYNTTGSFPTNENQTSQVSPYTVTDSNASLYPLYFATKDTVIGTDGNVYYFYSSPIVSKLKLSFNAQGGTSVDPITYIAASPENSITLPYTSKANYSFAGWYTSSTGGTRVGGLYESYNPSTSSSTTLYAQWTLIPISQNYAPSISGSGISGTALSSSSGNYSYGTLVSTEIAYRTQDDFATYNNTTTYLTALSSPYTITDADASDPEYYYAAIDTVRNSENVVYYFYSSSIRSRFEITYVYNNGTGNGSTTFYSSDPNLPITLPSPTKTGNTFNGWYDSESGGTLIGNAGESYTPLNTNKTLYAQWTPITYTLTYDAAGGSVTPATKQIQSGSTYGTLPTPTRPGYTFLGWYTTLSYTSQVFSDSVYSLGANSRIYAKWQGNTYVLTLYPNYPLGGKLDGFYSQNNIIYGSAYGELPVLTRSGYFFDGWFDQAVGGTQITSSTIYLVEGNKDLYAHWTASNPVFSDQTITTTAYLNKDINTLLDNKVTASPVTSYSIVYSGSGLNPSSWISVSKESGTNNGILSGKPTQIGVYTFVVRATSSSGGTTDSGLITLTVYPAGKRSLGSSMTSLTVAKRFDGSAWVDLKIMKRFDGSGWQDIGNI